MNNGSNQTYFNFFFEISPCFLSCLNAHLAAVHFAIR